MTIEEAKQILNKRRELVNRIDKLLKKGEITDPLTVFKLQRKRVEGFDLQEEAELLVREADKAFYQQWVEAIIEQPGSWSFHLFQTDIQDFSDRLVCSGNRNLIQIGNQLIIIHKRIIR